ncbi:hypothetical protein NL676_021881 [Syzygium grande]|nr:hypothetical protein NL676_021881 [Syzygium grande]
MASNIAAQSGGSDSITPPPVDQNMFANLLAILDNKKFRKGMLETHAPSEGDVDVQHFFLLVKNTLSEATMIVDSVINPKGTQGSGSTEYKLPNEGFNPPIAAINEVACQITCKALDTKNVHNTMDLLLRELLSYSWVTKAVITLSSLALLYGDLATRPTIGKAREVDGHTEGVACNHKASGCAKDPITFNLNAEEKREYQSLERLFNARTDNVELIKALFYFKADPQPLVLGSEPSKKYNLESLRRKNVMLLISDQNLSVDDISILEKIYKEPKFKEEGYEIVWVPIIEQEGEDVINQFKNLQSQMPWYSVHYPTLINKVAIKIIKEKWHFRRKTIVTVLDPQGRVSNQNAMSLIRVWGWQAFPFTDSVGADLWKRDINRFELLVTDMIFPKIHEAIKSENYILLYGAEDPRAMKEIEEQLKKIKDDSIPIDYHNVNIPLFWSRLESCMHLKLQTNANVPDALVRDILNLYTYFKKHGGFVVLTKGSRIVTIDTIVSVRKVFSKYSDWKEQMKQSGKTFEKAFMDFRNLAYVPSRCNDFCIPTIVDYIPENMKCPDCPSMMKINFSFECCHGER